MIEQGIYFALGCFGTALVALLFAPVFWRRALRLTRQRLQLQIPLSMQEILAERDELRAEFAVERVRLEQELTRVQARADALMAEHGRQIVAGAKLEETRSTLHADLTAAQTRLALLETEAAATAEAAATQDAALRDMETDRDGWRERTMGAQAQQERLAREIESLRTTIAGLETAKAGLELRLLDSGRALANEQETARTLRARLETVMMQATRHEGASLLLRRELDDAQAGRRQIEQELSLARATLRDTKREHEGEIAAMRNVLTDRDKINGLLRRERDEVRVQLAKTENELAALRAEVAERANATAREAPNGPEGAAARGPDEGLERKLRAAEAALAENRERDRAASLARGLLAEKARRTERLLEDQVKALSAENEQLRAAMTASNAAPAPPSAGEIDDGADLRKTIHALGLAVADIARRMDTPETAAPPNRRRKQGDSPRSVGAL